MVKINFDIVKCRHCEEVFKEDQFVEKSYPVGDNDFVKVGNRQIIVPNYTEKTYKIMVIRYCPLCKKGLKYAFR